MTLQRAQILCIDWKNEREKVIASKWRKDWGESLRNTRVIDLINISTIDLSQVILVLVHDSALRPPNNGDFDKATEVIEKKVRENNHTCAALVSASGIQTPIWNSDDGRMWTLKEPFPREVGHLGERIQRLSSALQNPHPVSRKAAWDTFDAPTSQENVVCLVILCQGFLAQYALKNRIKGTGVDTKGYVDVGNALKAMGWVEDEAAEQVSQAVVELDLDAGQPTPDIAFWTDPFEGSNSLRVGIQSELPKSLTQLPDIEKLINAIEQDTVNTVGFEDTVAKAYLELNKLLEAV